MSYNSDLPTPEAEIDKGLDFHTEDVKHTLPVGDGYVDDPSKGRVQTVRNVCPPFSVAWDLEIDERGRFIRCRRREQD